MVFKPVSDVVSLKINQSESEEKEMYVHWIRKDTAEDADLYEELRYAWDGIDYAGLPSFDDVLPDILEWVRGIRKADTVFNDYTYRASRLLYFDNALDESNIETAVR